MPEYFDDPNNWKLYRDHIEADRPVAAISTALELLSNRRQTAPTQYPTDHKGVPFYVLGYAAFASHDYTSASLYFDAAVAADLQFHKGKLDTPALQFMQLLQIPTEPVLAGKIIADTEASVIRLLDYYHTREGMQAITLKELRSRFFQDILVAGPPHRRTLITAFISFVAEWPYRTKQAELITEGSREPFFLHLFRGCLLFESLLKGVPGVPLTGTLKDALHKYRVQLGVGRIRSSANTVKNILEPLVDGMDMTSSSTSCARCRNALGHNLVWSKTDLTFQTYDLLVKNIAASCLHAISKLYP